jgi:putative nucleotidyltransferase with HDIG domain
MISYEDALEFLKKNIKDDEETVNHCINVSQFSFKTAKTIKQKHPELDIDPEKLRIAGLLHDIAKDVDIMHYFEGKKKLQEAGLKEIGKIISKHMKASEVAEFKGIQGDFIPKTIEEKILAYADLNFYKANKVTPLERLDQKVKSATKKNKPHKVMLINKARPRLLDLAEEIDGLFFFVALFTF